MAKEYFNAYHSYLENMKRLSDAEVGRLFRALLKYSMTGTLDDLPGNEKFVVDGMTAQIDRDSQKYAEKCEKQKLKAEMRWNAVACNGMPWHAENAKEKKKEKEKEKKKENIKEAYASSSDAAEESMRKNIQRVIDVWNTIPGINRVERINSGSKRYQSLKSRLDEYGPEKVFIALEKVRKSDFLRGKSRKGWVITFDWFVLPNNFPKVLEGNYDNREDGDNGTNCKPDTAKSDWENLSGIIDL